MKYIEIENIIFSGKQHISWSEVEKYLRRYEGTTVENYEYGDIIRINTSFADEYVHSQYTRKLRGGFAKVKANLVQVVPDLVRNATNRRWIENKDKKHEGNAIGGWYRYDAHFSICVKCPENNTYRKNYYLATILVRINDTGMYLYDIVNIKKEARKPMDS